MILGKVVHTLRGHTGFVLSLALLNDGTLASGGRDSKFKIWDVKNGSEIKSISTLPNKSGRDLVYFPYCLHTMPDGQLASGGYGQLYSGGSYYHEIKLWK